MNDPSVAEEYAEFSNRALTLLSFRRVILPLPSAVWLKNELKNGHARESEREGRVGGRERGDTDRVADVKMCGSVLCERVGVCWVGRGARQVGWW